MLPVRKSRQSSVKGQFTYRVAEVRRRRAEAAGCVLRETGASCGRRVSPWLDTVLWLGNQTRVPSDIVCKRKWFGFVVVVVLILRLKKSRRPHSCDATVIKLGGKEEEKKLVTLIQDRSPNMSKFLACVLRGSFSATESCSKWQKERGRFQGMCLGRWRTGEYFPPVELVMRTRRSGALAPH